MAVYKMNWIIKVIKELRREGGFLFSVFREAGRMGQWNGRRAEGESGHGEKGGNGHEGRTSLLGDKKGAMDGYISTWLHRWRCTVTVGQSRSVVCSQTSRDRENMLVCVDAYVCAHEARGSVGTEVGKGGDEDECECMHS